MDEQAWDDEGGLGMEKFNFMMLLSGYCEYERELIVREGLARVENIKKKVERGERPLYRMVSWRK